MAMTTYAQALRLFWLALIILAPAPPVFCAGLEVFASFEDAAEVAAVRGTSGVRLSASRRFPAWDGNSLEAVFPAGGGKIELTRMPADWRRQESLLIFVWGVQPAELRITLLDDQGGSFIQSFPIRTGVNHLQLRLARAKSLARDRMRSLTIETGREGTFYLDYFALDRFHPVLEQRGRWDLDYSMEVETPHVAWARPFAGGRIKVWALADVADGRGIVELAQRLALDFRATSIGRSSGINKWGFGDFYEHRSNGGEDWNNAYSLAYAYIADDLLNGPDYDVILWPGIHPWETYPIEIRNEIRRRVEAGAGLVLFYPNSSASGGGGFSALSPLFASGAQNPPPDRSAWERTSDHYITRGVPLEAFPWGQMRVAGLEAAGEVLLKTSQGAPVLAVRKVGKGRVAAFGYQERGMIPDVENVFETGLRYAYHEYLWSLVSRAVVWAAKREPQAAIRSLQLSPKSLRVSLDHAPEGAEVAVTIRSSFDEFEAMEKLPVRQQTATLVFPDALSGGRHFAEAYLIEKGRGIDWAARTFEVPAQTTIRDLVLESDRVKLGAQVNARLRLQAPVDSTITARLYDNYDRLLDERRYPVKAQGDREQAISLNSTGALTHLARVDCEVATNGRRADRRIQEVFVLQPRQWDDYDIVMYLFGPNPIPGVWPTIDAQMRRLNVTTLSSYTLQHSKHANYNIQAQTRISGQESPDGPKRAYYSAMKKKYFETRDKKGLVREYCLNDPAYRELIRKELNTLTAPWVPFSPLSYYVYEEPSLTCYEDDLDLCFSTHCMTAMRGWLKGEYGALSALNRQWGTQFANWDEVTPDDTHEAQARGNYASWADHRTFMEKTYAESVEFVLGELRKIDPQGILLNSGTQVSGAHNAADYSRLNRFTKHLNAYDGGNQLDFHRAFNSDLKISSGAGYGVLGRDVLYNFYSNLFKGSNGGAYIFWQYSTLDVDLTMSQSGKDMEQGFRELRGEGIGKLVGFASPDNHGIAIHYSYPSIHGAWIVDGKIEEQVVYDPSSATMRRFNANRDGWVKALHDAGLQFDFIGYGDVEKGGLISKGYRTFILPMSVALSEEEVRAIREFVNQGGTVIADALPGIMDKHCTFRPVRALADVFGVEPAGSNRQAVVAMNGEPGLKLAGAASLAVSESGPQLLEHRVGRGRAYLLNFFLDSYPADRLEKRNTAALEKVNRVLSAAGIAPKVKLASSAGNPISDCDRYLFNNGMTKLLGLLPDKDGLAARKALVTFDQAGALYDVRQKRYLGAGSTFEIELEPAIPRLLALVEERIAGIAVQAPAAARRGEEVTIGFRVNGAKNLRSVARVVVTDASGREASIYGGNRDIVNGAGEIRFRTALNDPPGGWRVTVTEAVSGEQAQAEIRIQ
ncbi:MAG: beta-galactosidase [Blastocatellia bacterium]|nr:beta-galactosidase [Blastocatellia bacterium]